MSNPTDSKTEGACWYCGQTVLHSTEDCLFTNDVQTWQYIDPYETITALQRQVAELEGYKKLADEVAKAISDPIKTADQWRARQYFLRWLARYDALTKEAP